MKYPITRGYNDAPGKMEVASGIAIDSAGRVDKFMNRYKDHLDKKKKK